MQGVITEDVDGVTQPLGWLVPWSRVNLERSVLTQMIEKYRVCCGVWSWPALHSYLSDSNWMHLQTIHVHHIFSYHTSILAIGTFSITKSVWIISLLTQSFIKPTCCACYEHIFNGQTFEEEKNSCRTPGTLKMGQLLCYEPSVTNYQSTLRDIT